MGIYRDRAPETIAIAYHLAHCAPADAVAWLNARKPTISRVLGTPITLDGAHLPEYILLRRRDARIDLALARNGTSRIVLGLLWRRGGTSLRLLLCGNASLFEGDTYMHLDGHAPDPWDILLSGNPDQRAALAANPHLRSRLYGEMLRSWEGRVAAIAPR
jgi:hypothetical protein